MTCNLCLTVKKDWNGGDRECAFDGEFSRNWNCATLNKIRDICYEIKDYHGVDFRFCDDQKYATVDISEIEISNSPLALWVSWYKNRGGTDAMWLLFEDLPPRKPTESELVLISEAYIERKAK